MSAFVPCLFRGIARFLKVCGIKFFNACVNEDGETDGTMRGAVHKACYRLPNSTPVRSRLWKAAKCHLPPAVKSQD